MARFGTFSCAAHRLAAWLLAVPAPARWAPGTLRSVAARQARATPWRQACAAPALGLLLAGLVAWPAAASAHDFRIGSVVIDHPYALPSPPGTAIGAVYLRTLRNNASTPERLLGASTPAAASVELHRVAVDGTGTRLHAIDGVPLSPGAALPMRHGGPWQLTLLQLAAPLRQGDSFAMTLRFEHAGSKTVTVTVQQPRDIGNTASNTAGHGGEPTGGNTGSTHTR